MQPYKMFNTFNIEVTTCTVTRGSCKVKIRFLKILRLSEFGID